MTSTEALTHIRYTGWASRKLMDAAKALEPADLTKPLGVSHTSILGTLAHTYFGDAVWYRRVADPSSAMPNPKEIPVFDELDERWRELLGRWEAFVASKNDDEWEGVATYTLADGSTSQSRLKEVLLHLVNHGTLHRGQVMAMFRQVGVKPPATDLIYYYRDAAASTS